MTNLLSQAKKLATDPPVAVYKKLMKLVADEQLSGLGAAPEEDSLEWPHYKEKKEACEKVASKYDDMCKELGAGVARFSVTSICDFMAMCMMMVGAGSERIEALKQAIRGKAEPQTLKLNNGDRACLLLRGGDNPETFTDILRGWCGLPDNGIVQFKFPAAGDFHTFVVERATDQNARTRFIVHQAYQNTYTLAHFLGIQSVDNDEALSRFHEQTYDALKENSEYKVRYADYDAYLLKAVIPQIRNIKAMVQNVGGKQELSAVELSVKVIQPLAGMLRSEIRKQDYVNLTGSPTSSARIGAGFMTMLICDQISPQKFEANCDALYKAPEITPYLDCGPKPKA